MADYTIDGVDYTIDDRLDLASTVAQIRASDQHFRQAAQTGNSFAGALGEQTRGAITAAGDLVASVPGMIGAAPYGIAEAVQHGPKAGLEAFGEVSHAMNPLTEDFQYGKLPGIEALTPDRQTGAYENLNKPFEMMGQGYGNIAAGAAHLLGASPETSEQAGAAGELGFGVGMAGTMLAPAIKGYRGAKAKAAAEAKTRTEAAIREAEAIQQQLMSEAAQKARDMQTQPDFFEPQAGPPTLRESQAGVRPGGPPQPLQPDLFDTGARTPQETALPQRGGGPIAYEPGGNMLNAVGPEATSPRIGPEAAGGPYARGHGYTPDPLMEPLQHDPRVFSNKQQPYSAVSVKDPAIPKATRTPDTEGMQFNRPGFLQTAEDKIYKANPVVEVTTAAGPQPKSLNRGKFGQAGAVERPWTKQGEVRALSTGTDIGLDIIKEHGEHVVEVRYKGGEGRSHNFVAAFKTAKAARVYAEDYAKWLRDKTQGDRPRSYDPKYQKLDNIKPANFKGFGQKGAVDFRGFMRETLDTTRVDEALPTDRRLLAIDRAYDQTNAIRNKVVQSIDSARARKAPEYTINALYNQLESLEQHLQGLHEDRTALTKGLADFQPIDPNAAKQLPGWAKKQYGGAYFENSKAKARDEFIKEARARGITVPLEQLHAIWDKSQQAPGKPLAHPSEPVIKTIDKIKGIDQLQRQYVDRRPLEEIKPQIAALKEDTLATGAGLNTVGKLLNGRFIAKNNPLLSWTSSQVHWTKNESIQNANNKLHGASRKMPDRGTFNFEWQQLPQKSRIAVTDLVVALRNSEVRLDDRGLQRKAQEVLKRPLTSKELQSFRDRDRIMGEVLADVNKAQIAEGKEPIGQLPHYGFPSIFNGPFKVKFVDIATGKTVKIDAFYLKPNKARLQAIAGKNMRVEVLPDSGLRGDVDWQQFEWILRQLSQEMRDPAARAITEGLRRQGFGARALKRSGVLGSKGTEGGVVGMRGYEEVSEQYIRQAYDYLANRKLDKIYKDVNELKEADHLPFTKAYALEAIDVARGGSNKAFDTLSRAISGLISGTVQAGTLGHVMLPQRFARDLLKQSNKVMTTLLLGFFRPTQIAAQFLQAPSFMPSKLMAMAGEAGVNPARVITATTRALAEYAKWNDSLDAKQLQAIGAFEAIFKYDWSTSAADNMQRYKQTLVDHLTGLSTLSALEAHAVRRPAAHMFLEMLRELGYESIAKDKNEIYYVAKEMTDQYMVTNQFYEKPHGISRSGLVGQALGPLQNFSVTWLGMFREYMALSAKGLAEGSISKQLPLGSFLAANLLTAGLVGVVGIKEWDMLANLSNKYLGTNIITGTEWIMSNFKSNKARFGLLSEALGYNVGATLNAPTLTGSFAPGLQLMKNAANAGWQGLKETGLLGEANKPTNVEKRDALKGIAPNFSPIPGLNWGDIERQYTRPGAPYQESSGRAGPVTRDEADWQARRWGTYTNKEAAQKGEFYAAQKDMTNRSNMFKHAMSHAVDVMLNDPQSYRNLTPVFQELGQRGFSGDNIRQGLIHEIESELIQADYRGMGKLQNTRQQQLAILLQRLKGQR